MIRIASLALLTIALLAGCGKRESSSSSSSGGSSGGSSSKYGSPEDTAKTFFAACAAADWKAVGECCAKPKEGSDDGIGEVRDGKLADGEKEAFKKGLGAAKAGAVTKGADGKTADVKFAATLEGKEKDGVLKMAMEGSDWKIIDLK